MVRTKSLLTKKLRSKDTKSAYATFGWRYFLAVGSVSVGLFTGLMVQMYRWQIFRHDILAQMANYQHLEDSKMPTSRGTIYTSDGTVMAVDEPVWDVYASLGNNERDRETFEKNRDHFIETVSQILDISEDVLDENLTEDFVFVPIKKGVSADVKKTLEAEDLFGLYTEEKEHRIYPNGSFACHVTGFVGKNEDGENVGMYGLEGYYSGDLLGQSGFKYEEKDSLGNVIMTGEYSPVLPRQGRNIVLTIRSGIQSKVEEILEDGVKKHGAKSGSVIIIDPQTGGILAMANYPKYDPNLYWREKDYTVFKNKAISDVYEYGSVNKVITVSSALEEKRITPDWICNDLTGSIDVLDKKIYTWDKNPDGAQQPKDVLKNSNNVCAVVIGQQVGIVKYHEYLRAFGIGDFLGIGLQDEATSYLVPVEQWNLVDLAVASFGQGISATPLQIASAVSAIANDGVRMRPQIVERIYDEDDEIEIGPQVVQRVLSEQTAVQVQDMMEVVVKEGEAHGWFDKYLSNYSIAGKTGTAQIPRRDTYGYYDDRTNATFVGFSPVHDAKMVMLVRIEEPTSNPYAASTAVPVWVDIYRSISVDLGIAPEDL